MKLDLLQFLFYIKSLSPPIRSHRCLLHCSYSAATAFPTQPVLTSVGKVSPVSHLCLILKWDTEIFTHIKYIFLTYKKKLISIHLASLSHFNKTIWICNKIIKLPQTHSFRFIICLYNTRFLLNQTVFQKSYKQNVVTTSMVTRIKQHYQTHPRGPDWVFKWRLLQKLLIITHHARQQCNTITVKTSSLSSNVQKKKKLQGKCKNVLPNSVWPLLCYTLIKIYSVNVKVACTLQVTLLLQLFFLLLFSAKKEI